LIETGEKHIHFAKVEGNLKKYVSLMTKKRSSEILSDNVENFWRKRSIWNFSRGVRKCFWK